MSRFVQEQGEALDPALPSILAAHVALTGSVVREGSEKWMTVGRYPELLKSTLHPELFDYVALGHMHQRQVLDGATPLVYPGSLAAGRLRRGGRREGVLRAGAGPRAAARRAPGGGARVPPGVGATLRDGERAAAPGRPHARGAGRHRAGGRGRRHRAGHRPPVAGAGAAPARDGGAAGPGRRSARGLRQARDYRRAAARPACRPACGRSRSRPWRRCACTWTTARWPPIGRRCCCGTRRRWSRGKE